MKNRSRSIVSLFIIILFTLAIAVNINYLSGNALNRVNETEYDVYYTYEYSRKRNYITVIRTPHYTPIDPFADLPEELKPTEEVSIKLGLSPPPYEPPETRSTGDKDYLIEPTAFTDDNSLWNTEASAYDWNNATNAETTASANDATDLDLHTFNTTDNQAEEITSVDIYIRADWSFTGNDYVTVKWYVGATQGTGTFTMNAANSGDDQIISFENVADPVDASWSWTDIGNILVEFDMERVAGNDLVYVRIDETWGWLDVVGATPDTTDPDIDSPADQEVELGSTSNSITWTVGDQNPNNYVIYRNDSNVESGAWTNGTLDADSGECDGLAVGIYNFTLWVDDDSSNTATDIVWFTISDQTAPVLTSPADDQYNEGSSSNTISWTVTELSPNDYIVYKNGSVHDSGVYSDGVPLNIDIDGQSLGIYNFTIWVDDDYGSEGTDEVWITVVDGTDPSLDSPVDIQYSEGSTSNIITWTATETNPDTYEVWQNGTPYDSGAYSNGVGIPINVDGLSLGFYNFTIRVNDTTNNFALDEVIVEVYDGTNPILDSPSNIDYELGATSNLLTWLATDTNANNYTVYKNGTIWSTYDSQSWTSGVGIEINIDGLAVGYYNFTILVHDIAYNGDSDEVIVHVTDTTDPLIDSPIDDSIELGSTIDDITWTGTDLDADNYEVFKNDSTWDSGNWVTTVPIVVELDSLTLGYWNFTIIVYDVSGNSVTDLVWITCEDNTNPQIDSPADDSYQFGSSSNTITWLATDLSADNYTCYKNGTIWSTYDSQSWTSGVNIVINIDGLAVGSYNFTIWVMDSSGNHVSDEVIIQVTEAGDDTDPVISTPIDQEIELGSTTDDISWTITEVNPNNYIVYKNDSNVQNGAYSNGVPVIFELDSLTLGIWNITIWADDDSSNFAVDLVWITVSDSVSPQVNSPSDFSYEYGSSSNTVEWTASDLSALDYYIYRNTTQVDYNTWTSEVQIQLGIDGLNLGIYNFTVIFYDVSLNYIVDLLWLTVEDTTNPQITNPVDDSYELGSSGNTISWTSTDLLANDFYVYKNSSQIDYNTWITSIPIVVDIDSFNLGLWNVTIICYDTSGNYIIDLVWITVQEASNDPVIHSVIPGVNITIEKGSETTITVNVTTIYTMNDVSIWYKINIDGIWHNISLTYDSETEFYILDFTSGANEGDIIFHYIKAIDNETNWSVSQTWQFNVILPEDKEDPWIHEPNTDEPNTDWSEIAIKAIIIIFGAMVIFGVFVYLLSDYARKIK